MGKWHPFGPFPKVNEDYIAAKEVRETEAWVQAFGGPTHEVTVYLPDGRTATERAYGVEAATGRAYVSATEKHRS